MEINIADIFSGIGGFSRGFHEVHSQYKTAFFAEKDKYARAVLARHYPEVPIFEDVADVSDATFRGRVDIITGGFPCQDLSIAGSRDGLHGERSRLFFEIVRLIGDFNPEWFVIENVPGLLTSNRGRDFYTVQNSLVKCGYSIAWRVFDAQYFGLAQRRKRVFIVGSRRAGSAFKVLFEPESGSGYSEQVEKVGQASPRDPHQRTGRNSNKMIAYRAQQFGWYVEDHLSGTLQNRDHKGGTYPALVVNAFDARNHKMQSPPNISGTIQSKSTGGHSLNYINPVILMQNRQQSGEVRIYEDISPTVSGTWGAGGNNVPFTIQPIIRRLTPVECERLQGFPDDWTAVNSDTRRYMQLGNAVAVPVVRWIASRILDCYKDDENAADRN